MDHLTTLTTLCLLLTRLPHCVLCIGFHLPDPVSFSHSCSPLGSWVVSGNLTFPELDTQFYSTDLSFRVKDRELCTLRLEYCPEITSSGSPTSQMTSSSASASNICKCIRYTEDDYGVYVRQEVVQSDVGNMLKAVVPGIPKYAPLQASHDVGLIPGKSNMSVTYQIDNGKPAPLALEQNITACSGRYVKISVCVPAGQPAAQLKIEELGQSMTSPGPCIHAVDDFSFTDTDSHPVIFSYDEGAGCSFQEKFVFNVREEKNGCVTQSNPTVTSPPQITTPTTATAAATTTTTTPSSSTCMKTPTSSPRQLATLSNGIRVMCDTQTDGGNWVVVQRRTKGDVDFYRGWTEYVAGFGDLDGDHWTGLQDIHTLCPPSKPCSLRVDLKDPYYNNGNLIYAEYSTFSLGGFTENYRLYLGGYSVWSTLSDVLVYQNYHNGMSFSTFDSDNDDSQDKNCAEAYHGGWWYSHCQAANLNGRWGVREKTGLRWHEIGLHKDLYATYSEMKVRVHV